MKIKCNKKIQGFVVFLLVFCFVLQTNNFVYANNFALNTANISTPDTDGMQKVTLDWDAPTGATDPIYYVMRKDSTGDWIPISAHQNSTDDPVDILMVYPHDDAYYTLVNWTDYTNSINGDAPDINVSHVHTRFSQWNDVYNGITNGPFCPSNDAANGTVNAYDIMSDGNGGWKYDVVVFGFWDNYKGHDLTPESVAVVEDFIQSSQGVLFTHDTLRQSKPEFRKLAPYTGMTLTNQQAPNANIQSSTAQVTKAGPITTYPFDLTGESFPVDISHTTGQRPDTPSNVWVKFKEDQGVAGSETFNTSGGFKPTDNNGFNSFLYSQENTAMIQTGNWADEAPGTAPIFCISPSDQEQKLIANTIYSLAQTTKNTTMTDKAEDFQAPNSPQLFNYDENTRELKITAVENGENYDYRVVAQPKDVNNPPNYVDRQNHATLQTDLSSGDQTTNSGDSLLSTSQSVSVMAGMKGFHYKLTTDPNYVPTEADTFLAYNGVTQNSSLTVPTTGIAGKYLAISAVDNNGNISAPSHFDMAQFPVLQSTVAFEHYDYDGNLITNPSVTINRGSMGTDTDHDGIITTQKIVSTSVNLTPSTVSGYSIIDKLPNPQPPAPDSMMVISDNGAPPAENIVKFKYAKIMDIAMKEVTHYNEDINGDALNNDIGITDSSPSSARIQENMNYPYTPPTSGANRDIVGYSINSPTATINPTIPTIINIDEDQGIHTIYIHYNNKPSSITEHFIDANGNDLMPPRTVVGDAGKTYYYQMSEDEKDDVEATPNGDCYTFDHAYKYDGSNYTSIANDAIFMATAENPPNPYDNDVYYKFMPNIVDVVYVGYDFNMPIPAGSTPGALATVMHHDPQTFSGTNPEAYTAPGTFGLWTLMTSPATHNIDYSTEKSITFSYKKGTPTGQYTANIAYKDGLNNNIGQSGTGHVGPTNFSEINKDVGIYDFDIPTAEITDGGVVYEFDRVECVYNSVSQPYAINNYTNITAPLNGTYDITVYYKAKATINYTFEIYNEDNIIETSLNQTVVKPMDIPYNLPNFDPAHLPPNTYIYSITIDGTEIINPTSADFIFSPSNTNHNIKYKIKTKTYKLDASSYTKGTNVPLTYGEQHTTSVDINTTLEPDVINGYVFEKFEGVNGSEAYFTYVDPANPALGIVFNTDTPGNYAVKAVYKQMATITVNYMGQNGDKIAEPITVNSFVGEEIQIPHPTQAQIITGMTIADYKPYVVYVENNNGGYTDITAGLVHDNIGFNYNPTDSNQAIYVGYQMKTYEVVMRVLDITTETDIIASRTSNPLPVTQPTHVDVPNVNQYGYEYVSLDYNNNLLTLDGQHSTVKPDDGGFASPYEVKVYVKKIASPPPPEPTQTDNPNVGNKDMGSSDEKDSTVYVTEPATETDLPIEPTMPTEPSVEEDLRAPLMLGEPDGNFMPKDILTRAEVAQVLYKALYKGEELPELPFEDVTDEKWYADAIKFAYAKGYMVGYPNGNFEPEEPVSRAEIMVILEKSMDIADTDGEDIFNDISGHWANEQINDVANTLDLEGFEDGSFRPDENIIRGDFAIILAKATNRVEYEEKISFADVDSNDYYYEYIMAVTNYCK